VLRPTRQAYIVPVKMPGHRAGEVAIAPEQAGFLCRLTLPVASDRLSHPPSREMRDAIERSNASVLGFLLQEVELEAMPRSPDERLATALAPLRIKLDILTDMVARISYRDLALPPVSSVELGPTHIIWCASQHWRRGDWLRLGLYFHPIFHEPITLLAAVTNCVDQDRDEGCRVEGELVEMFDSTRERLARVALLTQRQQQSRHGLGHR
jgi:hypothetical protein